MKVLQVKVKGLPLFNTEKEVVFDFYARQRVDEEDEEQLYRFNEKHNYYLNNSLAIVGINASGKTTALKVLLLAMGILNNQSINHLENNEILRNCEEATITSSFWNGEDVGKLETIIAVEHKDDVSLYYIKSEKLWIKPLKKVKSKDMLTIFSENDLFMTRNNNEEFLSNDVSIIISYNKKKKSGMYVSHLLSFANLNLLAVSGNIPSEIITFLDPSIERLSVIRGEKKYGINLKFQNENEIVLSDPIELNGYLSSGTVKGIITFSLAVKALKMGGYLIIDKIENHFNREIVATLLRLFNDSKLNKNGGTLIFTTHYSELLDEFDRNDCVYITRNREGITVENLKDILKRNDINKSEAFKSGFLDGTVPSYEAYMQLKKNIFSVLNRGENKYD